MPTIDGISCAIVTSDGPLSEYPCMPEMGDLYARSASAYIQGADNRRFTIKVTCDSSVLRKSGGGAAMGISCLPVIDGVAEPSVVILHPSLCADAHCRPDGDDGGGSWESDKFVFSPLGRASDSSSSSPLSPHKQGVITLREARELGTITVRLKYFRGDLPNGDATGEVDGAAAGGGGACMKKKYASRKKRVGDGDDDDDGLGDNPPRRGRSTHIGSYSDSDGSDSLVIFHFVYKSQRALEYMGFLPCPDDCLSPAFSHMLDDEGGEEDGDGDSSSGEDEDGEIEDIQLSEEEEEDEEGVGLPSDREEGEEGQDALSDQEAGEDILSDQEDGDEDATSPQILESEETASQVGEGEGEGEDNPPSLTEDQGDDDEDITPPIQLGQDVLLLSNQEVFETPPQESPTKPLASRKRSRSPISPGRIKRRSTRSRTFNPLG